MSEHKPRSPKDIIAEREYKKALRENEIKEMKEQEEAVNEDIQERNIEQELQEMKDRMLRAMAEMENMRRRNEVQMIDARKFAISSFAKDLIEPLDNLYRTLDNLPQDSQDENIKNIIDGLNLTIKAFTTVCERNDLKRITPEIGSKFDHNLHQAVTQLPSTEHEDGAVMVVMQAGYLLADRLIRPAMVAVAKREANNA